MRTFQLGSTPTPILNVLIEGAAKFRTAECFVVTPGYWKQLEASLDDPVTNLASALQPGRGPMANITVMGIPVIKTRGAWSNVEFAEVHHRPNGYIAMFERLA